MAGLFSDAEANALLDLMFRAVGWSLPSIYYAGLSSTTPNSDGTNVTEPTDANYARTAVTRSTGNFSAATGRGVASAVAISWPASTSGGSGYPGIRAVPLYSAATGGTFKGYLVVTSGPVSFGAGVTPTLPVGNLTSSIAA